MCYLDYKKLLIAFIYDNLLHYNKKKIKF